MFGYRTAHPVEGIGIFGEEPQSFGCGNLREDRLATRLDRATALGVASTIPLERSGHAEREHDEHDDHDDCNEIAHGALCYQTVSESHVQLGRAYAACLRLARQHYENFPVASWLLPRSMRHHVAAVYAFARRADDIADEGEWTPEQRLSRLDDWGDRLRATVGGTLSPDVPDVSDDDEAELIFAAVAATIRCFDLPVTLLEDLLSAFRQDVTVNRYRRWEDLLDYSRRSANPVGRLVLRIAGYRDEGLDAASDCVCTALQTTNFLQDLDVDWRRGRLYVPADVYEPFGATEDELKAPILSQSWKDAVGEMASRSRRLFDEGRPVCDAVDGRLGLELRLTWLGGCRILDRLGRTGYDPRVQRPSLGLSDGVPILWKAAMWRPHRRH